MAGKAFDVWDDVAEFLTSTSPPEQVLEFRPSEAARVSRVWDEQ